MTANPGVKPTLVGGECRHNCANSCDGGNDADDDNDDDDDDDDDGDDDNEDDDSIIISDDEMIMMIITMLFLYLNTMSTHRRYSMEPCICYVN